MSKKLSLRFEKKSPERSRMWNMTFTFSVIVLLILITALMFGVVLTYILFSAGVFEELETGEGLSRGVSAILLFLGFSSVIIGLVFSNIVLKAPLRPFHQLIKAMDKLAAGDFSVRIDFTSPLLPYEFIQLTESFNKMAEELSNTEMLRSDFVHNFSHEFKTPINSMRGFAKLLLKGGCTPEEEKEYLEIIVKESERLTALSTNVLNLTKIEKQTIAMDKKEYNLAEQVRRTVLMLEPKWSAKNLEPDIQIPDTLLYNGNEDLLNQVWINLIDNAIKFSPENAPLGVSLLAEADTSNVPYVVFSVRDRGIGMDEATKKHIFDKFYQGDTSHATEGNGIGLAIVRKIVDLYQGTITVDSVPGEGSLFTVRLPR